MSSNKKWFIKTRGSYLPKTWQGALTYIPYLTYLIGVSTYVYYANLGFWTSILIAIPNWVTAGAIMSWVAARKS